MASLGTVDALTMSPAARKALSATIRDARARLLRDLDEGLEAEYQLDIPAADVTLSQGRGARRARVDAHLNSGVTRAELIEEAAYTLLNRLVFLRLFEARGLVEVPVLTGGWDSEGYREWREHAAALVAGDTSAGYAALLRFVFAELAIDLPGLFGAGGAVDLVPVRADTLRALVEALDDEALADCWQDPLLPGWIYQYFNDPAREDLDKKIKQGKKITPREIASKTQMFTERYMVDWLLQNSLGPIWLAICARQQWTPDAETVLDALEVLQADWRARLEAGTVAPDALMPLRTDAMHRWAYHMRQPLPADAVANAPESLKDVKLIDPACGSGHFLVVALELMVALLEEEARHRGLSDDPAWSRAALVEHVLGHCLHGLDIDPRAVQIAAAALWIEARRLAPRARPTRMNLVASRLRMAGLPANDPARLALREAVAAEIKVPGTVTDALFNAVAQADHLGSLLKVDTAIRESIEGWEKQRSGDRQTQLFQPERARRNLLSALETFLSRHTQSDDLGLRLGGEQLAAGVRFVRMVQEDQYHLVVGNPPYQGTSKMQDAEYVKRHYALGKADLFAAFLLRGLELCQPGGTSALLTMRNWMFIKQYAGLRTWLLENRDLRALGDFDRGAFGEVPDEIVSVVVSVFRKASPAVEQSVALQPTPLDDTTRDSLRTARKRAATRCQVGRFEFEAKALKVVPEWPLVYWWSERRLGDYSGAKKLSDIAFAREGLGTKDDTRFLRYAWEPLHREVFREKYPTARRPSPENSWVPFVKGAAGREWIEPLETVVDWHLWGGKIAHFERGRYGRGAGEYFRQGIAIKTMGAGFSARAHRYSSIIGHAGTSVYFSGRSVGTLLCQMNSFHARATVADLNPTTSCAIADVVRMPLQTLVGGTQIYEILDHAFSIHESHREPSVEFKRPGPSAWDAAQAWAQLAVDRPAGAPLPEWTPAYVKEHDTDHISYALGVALGRFGPAGEGVLDPSTADLSHALPRGILFLDGSQNGTVAPDGLNHPATQMLRDTWAAHGKAIAPDRDLRGYLQNDFFDAVHRSMYENKPIHWPLSSSARTFVAWVTIHRMDADTLPALLTDHLLPALRRLDGRLTDLSEAAAGDDRMKAERERVSKWRAELQQFVTDVSTCARVGPPSPPKTPARNEDAPYDPHLDDGVMINSAALWPLLDPQWSKPREWWTELAKGKGRKNYDWSHLAARYWPLRVDAQCRKDPSFGVAHGCFWRYHPAAAFKWELRLQVEIGPDFRIDEADSDTQRAAFIEAEPKAAIALIQGEVERRLRALKKAGEPAEMASMRILDAGLWTAEPAAMWQMELAVIKKQSPKKKRGKPSIGKDFRLLSPDESAARAAYEAAHPQAAADRATWVAPGALL